MTELNSYQRGLKWCAIALLAALAAGCSKDPILGAEGRVGVAPTPPVVSTVAPANNAIAVPVNSTIALTFDQAMAAGTDVRGDLRSALRQPRGHGCAQRCPHCSDLHSRAGDDLRAAHPIHGDRDGAPKLGRPSDGNLLRLPLHHGGRRRRHRSTARLQHRSRDQQPRPNARRGHERLDRRDVHQGHERGVDRSGRARHIHGDLPGALRLTHRCGELLGGQPHGSLRAGRATGRGDHLHGDASPRRRPTSRATRSPAIRRPLPAASAYVWTFTTGAAAAPRRGHGSIYRAARGGDGRVPERDRQCHIQRAVRPAHESADVSRAPRSP